MSDTVNVAIEDLSEILCMVDQYMDSSDWDNWPEDLQNIALDALERIQIETNKSTHDGDFMEKAKQAEQINVGIIGAGFVGTACEIGFLPLKHTETYVYDKHKQSQSLHTVVENCDVLFVCVPTPMQKDGRCDLTIVYEAISSAVKIAKSSKVFVIKSTVSVGMTWAMQKEFPEHEFVFNPEFLTEANFVDDFVNQPFVILGQTKDKVDIVERLYERFLSHQEKPGKIIWTDASTAEMAKYTVNCFLAAKVSFFNEISEISKACMVNYDDVVELVKNDERIGKSHMQVPGPDGKLGWSGKCFPKDVKALMHQANGLQVTTEMLRAAWEKNLRNRPEKDWERIPGACSNR